MESRCRWLVLNLVLFACLRFSDSAFVLFCTGGGSPSHARGMFEFGQDLLSRNHRVMYAGLENWLPYAAPYGLDTLSLGPDPISPERNLQHHSWLCEEERNIAGIFKSVEVFMASYEQAVRILNSTFVSELPDLVVVDFFADACTDWAASRQLLYVVVARQLAAYGPESMGPFVTSLAISYPLADYSFLPRAANHIIRPLVQAALLLRLNAVKNARRAPLGMPLSWNWFARVRNRPGVTSTVWGVEPARYLLPKYSVVGALLPPSPPPLDAALESFLSREPRTILLAVGSQAVLPQRLVQVIYEAVECARVALIWATGHTDVWSVPAAARNSTRILQMKRVPQMSLLAHAHVVGLVMHGGSESTHEAAYYGKPTLVLHFYGDQRQNAYKMHDRHTALVADPHAVTAPQLCAALVRLANPNSTLHTAARRLQRAVRVESRGARRRAVDMLEELVMAGDEHYGDTNPDDARLVAEPGPFVLLAAIAIAIPLTSRMFRSPPR
mmetsp:Transcript_1588/g.3021  ORF Transcript_1588/g.3021 Transcript_1588/m.3021 type:complete len:499 (-) Transcript_1588:295-1791(-)